MTMRKPVVALLAACLVAGALWAAKVPSKGKVTCSDLNVRTGPGTNFNVVGVIHQGDEVNILDVSGSWFRVNVGSFQGKYVYAGYVDVTEYTDAKDDEASKRPVATLYGTDPKRPEAAAFDKDAIPRNDF